MVKVGSSISIFPIASVFGHVKFRGLAAGAWHPIIWTLPFPFHFDTFLRCRMTKTVIDPGQWILASFGQHMKLHGGFLVGGRVGYLVRVAAGEAVHRAFR